MCLRVSTLEETRLWASLVEGSLRRHGVREERLLYVSYDHVLADRGRLTRVSQEHDEIDLRLEGIGRALTLSEAKASLRSVLTVAKSHFLFEELHVFPAIEQTLQTETLEKLGGAL